MNLDRRITEAETRAARLPTLPTHWDLSRLSAAEVEQLHALARKAGTFNPKESTFDPDAFAAELDAVRAEAQAARQQN